MAAGVTMRQMLEAGVHFGHQTRRWNPHMRQFIFSERNGIHILDLAQTVNRLDQAIDKVREVASSGDQVLFVGTKKQAQAIVEREAERCGMPYVNTRWLGGTLTNFATISKRIEYYKTLEQRFATAAAEAPEEAVEVIAATEGMTKRERMMMQKEYERLQRSFAGLRNMTRLPGLVFIVDPTMEEIAVREANRAGVPIVAMCDTNADPDPIDYPIPSNDDAIRAIQLITARVAEAVLEGLAVGEVEQAFDEAMQTRGAEPSSGGEGAPAPSEAERTGPARQPRPAAGAQEEPSRAEVPAEAESVSTQGVDEALAERNAEES